ncbi:DNA-3-methyladenine glycosylase [Carnobacterium divergens]|uniref:DNA-3-methyladenine glycosylase n=1 Tax=Carnobacterium divergens TaxID=2748 RepID=UPI0039AFC1EC
MEPWLDNNKTTEEIAKALLGRLLIKETPEGTVSGWIVETEAYLGVIDEAAHSFNGKNTPRLKSMYEEAGTIYIYQMHTHQMLNLVVKEAGTPEAVLIRGIEPFVGLELMETRRGKTGIDVSNGPGKLTKAFGITQMDDGSKIYEKPLYLAKERRKIPLSIDATPRIGVPNKGPWTEAPLRFSVAGNPYVSKRRGKLDGNNGWLESNR